MFALIWLGGDRDGYLTGAVKDFWNSIRAGVGQPTNAVVWELVPRVLSDFCRGKQRCGCRHLRDQMGLEERVLSQYVVAEPRATLPSRPGEILCWVWSGKPETTWGSSIPC